MGKGSGYIYNAKGGPVGKGSQEIYNAKGLQGVRAQNPADSSTKRKSQGDDSVSNALATQA